jgi:branched-chain amino acid transport system permease protein
MEALLHQVCAGLASGAVYASLALALVMIYRVTHFVNFAQGELALCSTYVAWAMIDAGVSYWLAFVATVAMSFAMGVVVERVVIRPAMSAPALGVVIVFIGLMVVLNSVAGWVFGYTTRAFPSPFPTEPLFGNHYLGSHELGVIGVTLAMLAVLYAFFRFTSLGLALRAVADNPESSRLVGIRVERMLALGWGLSAVVGAIAGMMIAPIVFLDPSMMSGVMLYAFAAALLGGIDSPVGAVVGGFTVGILENLVGTYVVGTELKLTTALALIVGVLIFRPAGLFGQPSAARV